MDAATLFPMLRFSCQSVVVRLASCEVGTMTLDLNGAMVRLGNDVALFEEFIGFYEEDYPRLLKELEEGVENRNSDAVHHAAHGLKGLVASLGATDVAGAAGSLERMGRTKDFSEADEVLSKLAAEIEKLNSELAAFRRKKK
jgi:HPt (histidine-containing phosphotransfer) domain-containing protein